MTKPNNTIIISKIVFTYLFARHRRCFVFVFLFSVCHLVISAFVLFMNGFTRCETTNTLVHVLVSYVPRLSGENEP